MPLKSLGIQVETYFSVFQCVFGENEMEYLSLENSLKFENSSNRVLKRVLWELSMYLFSSLYTMKSANPYFIKYFIIHFIL